MLLQFDGIVHSSVLDFLQKCLRQLRFVQVGV
jgi:hypothetical protein